MRYGDSTTLICLYADQDEAGMGSTPSQGRSDVILGVAVNCAGSIVWIAGATKS